MTTAAEALLGPRTHLLSLSIAGLPLSGPPQSFLARSQHCLHASAYSLGAGCDLGNQRRGEAIGRTRHGLSDYHGIRLEPLLPASMSDLVTRFWNNAPIGRRPGDGYVNATAMCKANGKHLPHYTANDRSREYMDALSRSVGIPTDLLVRVVTTGPNDERGTWVHPRIAVELARWISPEFGVWMDGWFLETIQQPQPSPVTRSISPMETLGLIERGIHLMEHLGELDDRDRACFKDMIRSTTARGAGGLLLPPSEPMMALSDALIQCGAPAHKASALASQIGRTIKQRYIEEHGRAPRTHKQTVLGKEVDVCDYEANWLQRQADFLKDWLRQKLGR